MDTFPVRVRVAQFWFNTIGRRVSGRQWIQAQIHFPSGLDWHECEVWSEGYDRDGWTITSEGDYVRSGWRMVRQVPGYGPSFALYRTTEDGSIDGRPVQMGYPGILEVAANRLDLDLTF